MPRVGPLLVTPPPGEVTSGLRFDQAEVDRTIQFFRTLRHTKGRWAGRRYDPLDWEIEHILAPVFGWKHRDGTRVIRTALVDMTRKQGKSTRAAAIGLKLLAADREPGAEVYAGAGARQQARFVFDPARKMARQSPGLARRLRVFGTAITYPATGSTFQVLSSAADLQHGANVHGGILDELHIYKTRDLVDVIETGTGSRSQPLIVFITTADDGSQTSIYNEKRSYLEQLAAGTVVDPSFYGVVFAAPDDADPFAERSLELANPGIDITVNRDYLRSMQAKAKALPGFLPTYKRLHLGIRDRSEGAWFDLARWDQAGGLLDEASLRGEACYAGVDLANTQDFTAWMLWFPSRRCCLTRLWVPEAAVRRRRDTAPQLLAWAAQGYLNVTDGDLADEDAMRAQVDRDAAAFHILEVGYDPWNATGLVRWMAERGLACVPVAQSMPVLTRPTKELERMVVAGDWNHGGHPVLRWQAGNARLDTDRAGTYRKPSKRASHEKIDGIAGLVVALERCLAAMPESDDEEPEADIF